MSIRPTILKHLGAQQPDRPGIKCGPHSVERLGIDREYNDSPAQ